MGSTKIIPAWAIRVYQQCYRGTKGYVYITSEEEVAKRATGEVIWERWAMDDERLKRIREQAERLTPTQSAERKYEPNSHRAKQGAEGENRFFDLIAEALADTEILIAHGLPDPSANGKLGDILFRRSTVDAPSCGIEVKTSSFKYPNSVCLSKFEFESSTADFLACGNADPNVGWWFCSMEDARRAAELKKGGYYVIKKQLVGSTISFAELVAEIRGKFV